jgi:tetratricopeptide (TPR) repeat protein
VQAYPYDSDGWYLLANLYFDLKRWSDARESCLNALGVNPNHAAALNLLGILQDDSGELDSAILNYQQALAIDPNYASAHGNLGLAYENQGKSDLAQTQYEEAIRLNPNEPIYKCRLGVILRKSDRAQEGDGLINACEQIVTLSQDDSSAHNALGMAYLHQQKYELASSEFIQSIRLEPNESAFHSNLANAYDKLGRNQEAIEEAETALALGQYPFVEQYQLMNLRWASKDYVGAMRDFALVWLLGSMSFKIAVILLLLFVYVVIRVTVGTIRERSHHRSIRTTIDYLTAKRELSALLAISKWTSKFSVVFKRLSNKQIQRTVQRVSIQLNRVIAYDYAWLGEIREDDGDEADALKYRHKSFTIDPTYRPAVYSLITYYCRKDDLFSASQVAFRSSCANPKDTDIRIQLGDIYMLLNKVGKAIQEWQIAVRTNVDNVINLRLEQLRFHPTYAAAHFTLGLAFKIKKDTGRALIGFETAASTTNNHHIRDVALNQANTLKSTELKSDQRPK